MSTSLQQMVQDKIQFLSDEELASVLKYMESIRSEISTKRKTIAEKFADIRAKYPEETWDDMPVDGAENLDHYLYGHPKKAK
jgi:hypothetical protein